MSGPVFAGQLRRRVTLQIPSETIDDSGVLSRVYETGPQVWAHIRTLRLSARYGPERPEGVVTHHLTFRAIAGFQAGYRFDWGGRVFETLSFEICEGLPSFMRACCQEIQP